MVTNSGTQKPICERPLDVRRASKTFCRAAFGSLHISIEGDAKPCCEFAGALGNLRTQSVEEIWFSEGFEQLRAKMLRGERDIRCWKCDEKEDAGVPSLRDTYDQKKFIGDADYWSEHEKAELPKRIDLRFSNLCNLSCRTCGPEASTKWHSDAKQLGWLGADSPALNEAFSSTAAAIRALSATLETIDEIYFTGGEPLLHEGHYAVLNELLRFGRNDVRLFYNSNLMSLGLGESRVVTLWSQFKYVYIGASIDGYEKQGELIRQGLSWREFTDNVSVVRKDCPHAVLWFSITVSVFNILSLPDLCERLRGIASIQNPRFVFNILQAPRHYSIQILPRSLKLKAKRRIQRYAASHSLQDAVKPIVNFMMFEDRSNELGAFRACTRQLDKLRNQNTAEIIPEIASLLREPPNERISIATQAVGVFFDAILSRFRA